MNSDSSIDWASEPDLNELAAAYKILRRDPHEAVRRLTDLASNESILSMVHLGWEYGTGNHVKLDLDLAESWLNKAIERGSIEATYCLGLLYYRHHRYDKAIKLFKIGAERNFLPYIYKLGFVYTLDRGVPSHMETARNYFELACKGGHILAKREYSILMILGLCGVRRIPCGLVMFLSSMIEITRQKLIYPQSDRLR